MGDWALHQASTMALASSSESTRCGPRRTQGLLRMGESASIHKPRARNSAPERAASAMCAFLSKR